MYGAFLAFLFGAGVVCLIIGGLKEYDKKWEQRHCNHDDHGMEPVFFGALWWRKMEVHCTGCDANMVYGPIPEEVEG